MQHFTEQFTYARITEENQDDDTDEPSMRPLGTQESTSLTPGKKFPVGQYREHLGPLAVTAEQRKFKSNEPSFADDYQTELELIRLGENEHDANYENNNISNNAMPDNAASYDAAD